MSEIDAKIIDECVRQMLAEEEAKIVDEVMQETFDAEDFKRVVAEMLLEMEALEKLERI